MKRLQQLVIAVATLATAIGCSSVPEEIRVAESTAVVPFVGALSAPDETVGKQARWGGIIADVQNEDDQTVIEVVNFTLQSWGRPVVADDSDGRFRAIINGFVDPVVFKKGRSVTFVGEIQPAEEGKIDEFTYLFPTLAVSGRKLWEEQQEVDVRVDYSPLWFRHNFYSPYRHYYPGHAYPVRSVPIQTQGMSTGDKGAAQQQRRQ